MQNASSAGGGSPDRAAGETCERCGYEPCKCARAAAPLNSPAPSAGPYRFGGHGIYHSDEAIALLVGAATESAPRCAELVRLANLGAALEAASPRFADRALALYVTLWDDGAITAEQVKDALARTLTGAYFPTCARAVIALLRRYKRERAAQVVAPESHGGRP